LRKKYQEQWERLGSADPFWAVLTVPEAKGNKWDKGQFWESGKREIDWILKIIEDEKLELNNGKALDFGCGVGRLSRALAVFFREVTAIDISVSMLQEAVKYSNNYPNIKYLHNLSANLQILNNNSFDFIYSNIVLQHMPKNYQKSYIKEFCRVLKPGGIMVFQNLTGNNLRTVKGWINLCTGNRVLSLFRRLKYGKNRVMELHILRKNIVIKILENQNMRVVKTLFFNPAGNTFKSYLYFAIKKL